jgi:transposase
MEKCESMRKPSRFTPKLSSEEQSLLNEVIRNHPSCRARHRAHAVLLSAKFYTVNEIADIFEVDRDTVCDWLSKYEDEGISGVSDKARTGRPKKVSEELKKDLERAIIDNPQNPIKTFESNKTTELLSSSTVRRAIKSLGYVWKRFRLTLKNKRNEEAFREGKKQIEALIALANEGKIDLYFFDEAGFSLKPVVPYGWIKRGESAEIPFGSELYQRLNVLGLLSFNGKDLYSCLVEGSIDSAVASDTLIDFCKEISLTNRQTVIVMDNAPIHLSEDMQETIEEIEDSTKVTFYFLPTYSPELNYIEILWKQMKHFWMGFDCYLSFTDLKERVLFILSNIGSKYHITFA